jgi:hypothetical protein
MVNMAGYDPLIDTPALAAWLKISPATVRSWAHRGRLTRRGRDRRGRALYSATEAAELIKSPESDAA